MKPLALLTASARATAHGWMMTVSGAPGMRPTSAVAVSYPDTDNAAQRAEDKRFDQELEQDVTIVGADALRRPISRVRSVTDTSMMFMMPMPPTTRLTAPMPPSSAESVPEIDDCHLEQVGLVADLEIVVVAGAQAVAQAQHLLDLRLGGVKLVSRWRPAR